jgi:hypothetical protein
VRDDVAHEHVALCEARPVGRDRLVQAKAPFLDQLQETDRDEPFRPREDRDEVAAVAEVDDQLAVDRRGEEPVLERGSDPLEAGGDDHAVSSRRADAAARSAVWIAVSVYHVPR